MSSSRCTGANTWSPVSTQCVTTARPTIPPDPDTRIFNANLPPPHIAEHNSSDKHRFELDRSTGCFHCTNQWSFAILLPSSPVVANPIRSRPSKDQSHIVDRGPAD